MRGAASLLVAVALTGCPEGEADAPDTPRTDVPDELAGDWYTGTLSTIQYYDRDTGEWQNPSGEGFYWILEPDGHYETGAVIDSWVAGCNMRLLGVEVGTVEVAGDAMIIHRHWVTTRITNTCGESGERTLGEETRAVTWSIDADESGLPWLSMVHPDGTIERYHHWD